MFDLLRKKEVAGELVEAKTEELTLEIIEALTKDCWTDTEGNEHIVKRYFDVEFQTIEEYVEFYKSKDFVFVKRY